MLRARALYDCTGDDPSELSFQEGEILIDVKTSAEDGWYEGRIEGTNLAGLFPFNYVEIISEQKPPLPSRPTTTTLPKPIQNAPNGPRRPSNSSISSLSSWTNISNNSLPKEDDTQPIITPSPSSASPAMASTTKSKQWVTFDPLKTDEPVKSSTSSAADLNVAFGGVIPKPGKLTAGAFSTFGDPVSPVVSANPSVSSASISPSPTLPVVPARPKQDLINLAVKPKPSVGPKPATTPLSEEKVIANAASTTSPGKDSPAQGLAAPLLKHVPKPPIKQLSLDNEDDEPPKLLRPSAIRQQQLQQQGSSSVPILPLRPKPTVTTKPAFPPSSGSDSSLLPLKPKPIPSTSKSADNLYLSTSSPPLPDRKSSPLTIPRRPLPPRRTVSRSSNSQSGSRGTNESAKEISPLTEDRATLLENLSSTSNLDEVGSKGLEKKEFVNIPTTGIKLIGLEKPEIPQRHISMEKGKESGEEEESKFMGVAALRAKMDAASRAQNPIPPAISPKPALPTSNLTPTSSSLQSFTNLTSTSIPSVSISPKISTSTSISTSSPTPPKLPARTNASTPLITTASSKNTISPSLISPPLLVSSSALPSVPLRPINGPDKMSPVVIINTKSDSAKVGINTPLSGAKPIGKGNPFLSKPPGIAPDARKRYETLFDTKNESGFVSGDTVSNIWSKSHLSEEELARIWNLADIDADGLLSKHEFCVGMWLIDERLRGKTIPTTLPDALLSS